MARSMVTCAGLALAMLPFLVDGVSAQGGQAVSTSTVVSNTTTTRQPTTYQEPASNNKQQWKGVNLDTPAAKAGVIIIGAFFVRPAASCPCCVPCRAVGCRRGLCFAPFIFPPSTRTLILHAPLVRAHTQPFRSWESLR